MKSNSNHEKRKQEQPVEQVISPEEMERRFIERIARNLCETAIGLVCGDRGGAYDHPYRNMLRTADRWNSSGKCQLAPHEVALRMIDVKLAREDFQHKNDNYVDIIGWIIVAEVTRQIEVAQIKAHSEAVEREHAAAEPIDPDGATQVYDMPASEQIDMEDEA